MRELGESQLKFFDADFFHRLERVRARSLRGREERSGNLPSPFESGEGLEFHDFRGYTPGDDPRYIDWNAYARLGRMFLKRFRKEEGPSLVLFLDLSRSMEFGVPPKERLARRLAGGLGIIALTAGARVRLLLDSEEFQDRHFEGRIGIPSFLSRLSSANPGGSGKNLESSLRQFLGEKKKQEIFFLTDLLFEGGIEPIFKGIAALRARGHECDIVQILSTEEREPALEGGMLLTDSESAKTLEIEYGPSEKEKYRSALEGFFASTDEFSKRHGVPLERVSSEEPFDEVLIRVLKGLVKQNAIG